ncbi:hypothetical protein DPMN_058868 [Dreissena polymorpha]|uniref:Uncharacterized protein n=1 Tax=Dreissena polymorpha TaxID=45954 RepID=A0A9D4HFY9_DREPO|nr:hypothetical protein DPMN_058868 [Dreissena polymorpha]
MTKFYKDWTINVTSKEVNFFQRTENIFELSPGIIRINHLTKFYFHTDWTITLTSREITRFYFISNNSPPPGGLVFKQTKSIFKLSPVIIRTNVLTKLYALTINLYKDWTINLAFRTGTIFKRIQYIIRTNMLTKFHDDLTINVTSRVFTRKNTPPLAAIIFLNDRNRSHILTNFHDDQTMKVASRVLTRKTPLSPSDYVFVFHRTRAGPFRP